MDWLLLLIGMTAEGGWNFHQTTFETKELCLTAQTAIQEQIKDDKDKFMRVTCIQTQTGYGSMRGKRK